VVQAATAPSGIAERLSAPADGPVVFVHGLWLHADSWNAWIERFRAAGYSPIAPGWPGDGATIEETRANPERVAGHGIDDVVRHYTDTIARLDRRPIAIGHSFGGLIVQRLLSEGHAAAAVAIDPAPIRGVVYLPLSSLRVASVALKNPVNRKRAVSLTRQQFRYGFGNALTETESDELYERWTIPSPGKPLFEDAVANLSPRSPTKVDTKAMRGPLLITAGGRDRTVPPTISRATSKRYRRSPSITDVIEFPDRGHSLTIDSRWAEVAEAIVNWLRRHSG
jgi:pimeloyl-ACP methyl ester carboxylesterase